MELACAHPFADQAAGEPARAAETLRHAAEMFPRSAEPALALSTAHLFRGDPDAAEAELRPLLARSDLRDEWKTVSQALARVDVYRGQYRRAVAGLAAAAAQGPQRRGEARGGPE